MDATVAPDKEADSLILELKLLSRSLYIPSFGTFKLCLCILRFLLLCTTFAPDQDVE